MKHFLWGLSVIQVLTLIGGYSLYKKTLEIESRLAKAEMRSSQFEHIIDQTTQENYEKLKISEDDHKKLFAAEKLAVFNFHLARWSLILVSGVIARNNFPNASSNEVKGIFNKHWFDFLETEQTQDPYESLIYHRQSINR